MLLLLTVATIMGCLLTDAIEPTTAYASTMTATTDMYQLYDTRTRGEQVTVNKVWDDGFSPEDREYVNGKQIQDYSDLIAITIQTGVPQAALRTYSITYDANGGTFGTDANGNAVTTNTVSYNAKNQPTNGTYAVPERDDGYVCIGWNTSETATTADTSITLTGTPTDSWMNARADGSTTTLYAVWKDLRIRYAVMAYGIGVDKDASGNNLGITFGPALGAPAFAPYNSGPYSVQTFRHSHHVSGDATIMSESAAACTDASHSVITGNDAGTDAAGNVYRCLHYDNWDTIIYWNKTDPHVYDKCIPNHCSKTIMITPNAGTIANRIFSASMSDSDRGLVGDGQSHIMKSQWDRQYIDVDITKAGQGYAASLIRAKLVGTDSHTKLDEAYAGTDALMQYTSESCVLSCFPENLRNAIGAKALSGVSAATGARDVVSNDGAADRLWLFSYGEVTSAVYPSVGFRSDGYFDDNRSNKLLWWLRSPGNSYYVCSVDRTGVLDSYVVNHDYAVAPGFTLP